MSQLNLLDSLNASGTGRYGRSGKFASTPAEATATPGCDNFLDEARVAKAADKAAARVRPNKFAANCADCGGRVPEGAGSLTRGEDGWETRHVGGCPAVEAPTPAPVVEAPLPGPVGYALHPGVYTVVRADGSHRTFKIVLQADDAEFAPGQLVLEYLNGADNYSDYKSCGFVSASGRVTIFTKQRSTTSLVADAQILATVPATVLSPEDARRLVADPDDVVEASGVAHVLLAKLCRRCGHLLSKPLSIERGLGPDCYAKAGD
jgi:hypothetical protein